jgi:hypothetical protein
MKITQIKEEVLKGNLILEKTYMGKRHRNKYIWDEQGDHIIRVDKITFDYWNHRAVFKDEPHKGYKISKKDWNELLKTKAN